MKLTIHIVGLVASLAFCIGPVHAGDEHCDCTIWPFKPDPPCFDRCVAKHLAISSANILENVFGLPEDAAKAIGKIPPQ